MALIKCPECGSQMSDRAWSCPTCAAPNKKARLPIAIAIGAMMIGLLFMLVVPKFMELLFP